MVEVPAEVIEVPSHVIDIEEEDSSSDLREISQAEFEDGPESMEESSEESSEFEESDDRYTMSPGEESWLAREAERAEELESSEMSE